MSRLVNDLIRNGYLRTDIIIDAFSNIHRGEFVPSDLRKQADANISLPIGSGQTISQPLVVAFMLELLDPKEGNNVLDIGSGSGWTTALLAFVVGEKGRITAIEVMKDLCKQGEKNVRKFDFLKREIIEFHCQSASKGFEKNAPSDRIVVSASVDEIPTEFKEQLVVGGKMVLPVRNEIWYVEKKSQENFLIEKFAGFSFVPFTTKH
jgi:protein-L-isoaspartate(D-aspartate) O-methyltransferase